MSTVEYRTRIIAFLFRWITLSRGNTEEAQPSIISRSRASTVIVLKDRTLQGSTPPQKILSAYFIRDSTFGLIISDSSMLGWWA